MARKNIGAKPYIMSMPVLMLSAYDWMKKIYLSGLPADLVAGCVVTLL